MNAFLFRESKDNSKSDDGPDSLNRTARLAGLFYLIFIILLPIATTMRSPLVVSGDAAATAQRILANDLLFRISYITELVSALFFVLAAWALYSLLRSINKDLALLFLLLNLSGVAIECSSVVYLSSAQSLINGTDYLSVIPVVQLQAQALFDIQMYEQGFKMSQLFFGAWLVPLGILVYRSGFLPKWLGVLLIIDFFGVIECFLQYFLLPGNEVISYPGYVAGFLAEVSLTVWLLVKGVNAKGSSVTEGG